MSEEILQKKYNKNISPNLKSQKKLLEYRKYLLSFVASSITILLLISVFERISTIEFTPLDHRVPRYVAMTILFKTILLRVCIENLKITQI